MPTVSAEHGVGQGPKHFWLALAAGIVVPLVFTWLMVVSDYFFLGAVVSICGGVYSAMPKTSRDFSEPQQLHAVPSSPKDNGLFIGSMAACAILVIGLAIFLVK